MSQSSPSGQSAKPTPVKAGRRPRQQLTARQNQALQHLTAGLSIRQTAEALGVDRRTVQRWLNEDPRFRAAYNAWQQEQIDSCRAQLLTMLGDAATAISKSIKKGDARIALGLLKQLNVIPPPPPAPSDPDLLRHATAIDHEERRRELNRRAKALDRDDLSPIENEERRNILENPTREYIAEVRDFCDMLERDLDLREGKPPKPRPSTSVPPARDPQTSELVNDSLPQTGGTLKAQPPSAPQPPSLAPQSDPQTHASQSNPPAPVSAGDPAPTPPAPPARNVARPTDEPEPLDPTGPIVAYNDPNTFALGPSLGE